MSARDAVSLEKEKLDAFHMGVCAFTESPRHTQTANRQPYKKHFISLVPHGLKIIFRF
jgi:hypothetical protein